MFHGQLVLGVVAAGLMISANGPLVAQQIDLGPVGQPLQSKRQHVELVSDTLTIAAAKPQDVELRFRVDPGFHINSHQPKDELLIPTVMKLNDVDTLKVLTQVYPKGALFRISVGTGSETLDVYTGEFRVGLRVVAQPGNTTLRGVLHYQACDNAACFPPRSLPVTLTLIAK